MSPDPLSPDERALAARLGVAPPPPPRRSDAAFARAVGEGASRARRPRGRLFVGAAALSSAAAAALVLVVDRGPPPDAARVPGGLGASGVVDRARAALPEDDAAALAGAGLTALVDAEAALVDDAALGLPALPDPVEIEDETLVAFASALDRALQGRE